MTRFQFPTRLVGGVTHGAADEVRIMLMQDTTLTGSRGLRNASLARASFRGDSDVYRLCRTSRCYRKGQDRRGPRLDRARDDAPAEGAGQGLRTSERHSLAHRAGQVALRLNHSPICAVVDDDPAQTGKGTLPER